MIVLETPQVDSISGGLSLSGFSLAGRIAEGLFNSIMAGGATLRNYYGEEMTIEIFAAGNMGA